MKKLMLAFVFSAFMVTGCGMGGMGFKRAYQGFQAEQVGANNKLETCSNPTVQPFSNKISRVEVMEYLTKNGYQYIGESQFGGVSTDFDPVVGWGQSDAVKFGRELGACLILYSEDFSHQGSMDMPVTTPVSATATVYGPAGISTATAYGTQTSYQSFNFPVNGFIAIYAVKVKPGVKPMQECKPSLGLSNCNPTLP